MNDAQHETPKVPTQAGSDTAPDSATTARPVATAEILRQVIGMQSFTRWTGLELIKAENGEVETRLKLRAEDMTQHHGFLHGGLVGFLADNAAAYAASTVVGDVVTAQYALNFFAPGIGDAFVTRAKVLKAGKRQVTVRSDVYALAEDSSEKQIATATAIILPV